ncbi:disease resistance protein RUN1-like [Rhodamnia argentea]|uniref:Disease resistance protein RUN1-like n=1 Tax=Rhodamnia argentea TaxID=178133 RepID=A0ABM3HMX3_9MYRT|nr:disease resistance protein RUN1-like [Rhodamnia argentea]
MGDEEANSGTATGGGDYDVFLSFRGPDTRNGFTDCLYEFMSNTGIRIFRDDEELRPGEKISEILRAVKRSQIYIPIFSKDYASSKWCLRELTCMVECARQSMGKEILPIFYDVDPSDVKLETELYESALGKHEANLGCTEVKPWRAALKTVAKIRGWHIKDQKQGKAIKDISQKVSQNIAIKKRDLPVDLIGIDDRIEAIEKLLDSDISDVRFVIIHGIGGIGKTSLAKAVFNRLSPQFEGHSFLSNIRESSSGGGVTKLQRKLVSDLFSFSLLETFDFEEGNNMIKKRLPTKRVLLVFDDMDENDQVLQLAMKSYLCGPGSRIIFTTRDKSVSTKTKLEGLEKKILMGSTKVFLYEMKELHFDHALQLFNKLAFNTDVAPCDLDLSREVVELTGGLPLALEVIGSHLRTMDKAKWKSTLKKLKEVPLEKVQQSLKISYDALGYEAQQIFLDIACFFVDKKITNAMYLWEACDLFPEVEIVVLINKSLIKIDHDRIWMHDRLRDFGRAIVRQENIGKPGERSRLGFIKTALDVVRARKGTENVIALALWRSRHDFTREDFTNLMNVRFLELDGGNFAGNFEEILPELRWLCWRNCPPKLRANNFVLNHLVVLKLSGHITAEEWSGWAEIMVASKLKVLKIAGSKSLMKTPCFPELTSLERLVLKDFPRLTQIDSSIGKLERLIYLKIKWCPRLGGLPWDIGHLTALRELILIQCFSVRALPRSICNLRGLSRLVMEDTGLVGLPDSIKGQADLEYLCLANCTSLDSLPDEVGELKSLTELDLSGTTIKELPHSIWNRKDLTLRLNSSKIRMQLMSDLPRLEGIEDCWDPMVPGAVSKSAPKKLKQAPHNKIRCSLEISYEALEYGAKQIFLDIACFFVNMKKTEAMYVWEACNLFSKVEIDVLVNRSLIEIVDHRIWMHDQVRDFGREIVRRETIGKFGDQSRLWHPEMAPDIIQAKRGTENVEAFTSWKLRHNYKLTPEDCANLRGARFLELDGQNLAGNFKIILPELRWLCWRNFPPKLQANNFVLNHLVVLKLSGDFTVEEWSKWVEMMVASKLKVLNLAGSKSFIKTPCFSEFMSLERLVLKDLPRLVEIGWSIGKLERLVYLKIKRCPLLRELPQEIGSLTALRELILIECCSVCYLPDSIGNLRLLSRLIVEDIGLVEIGRSIGKLERLVYLKIKRCPLLRELPQEIGSLTALRELILIECCSVCYLPDSIGNLRLLSRLIMEDTGLVEIGRSIGKLKRLVYLKIKRCPLLRELPQEIGSLTALRELILIECCSVCYLPDSIGI